MLPGSEPVLLPSAQTGAVTRDRKTWAAKECQALQCRSWTAALPRGEYRSCAHMPPLPTSNAVSLLQPPMRWSTDATDRPTGLIRTCSRCLRRSPPHPFLTEGVPRERLRHPPALRSLTPSQAGRLVLSETAPQNGLGKSGGQEKMSASEASSSPRHLQDQALQAGR